MTYMPLRTVTIDLGNLRGQIFSRTEFAPSGRARYLCVLQGRIGRPMAFSSRFLGHWPKDGPAALADGRRSSTLHFIASILLGVVGASLQEK